MYQNSASQLYNPNFFSSTLNIDLSTNEIPGGSNCLGHAGYDGTSNTNDAHHPSSPQSVSLLTFSHEGLLEVIPLPGCLFAGVDASADAEEVDQVREDLLDSEVRDDAAEANEEQEGRFAGEDIEEDADVMVVMVVLDATEEEDISRGLSDISTAHRSKGIQCGGLTLRLLAVAIARRRYANGGVMRLQVNTAV